MSDKQIEYAENELKKIQLQRAALKQQVEGQVREHINQMRDLLRDAGIYDQFHELELAKQGCIDRATAADRELAKRQMAAESGLAFLRSMPSMEGDKKTDQTAPKKRVRRKKAPPKQSNGNKQDSEDPGE